MRLETFLIDDIFWSFIELFEISHYYKKDQVTTELINAYSGIMKKDQITTDSEPVNRLFTKAEVICSVKI